MDVRSFFNDVISQNREGLKSCFSDDAVICWHCSNEQFTADEYIEANCRYPGSWRGDIERIEECGNVTVLAARVYPEDGSGSFHVVSFIGIRDGRISSLDEYWSDDGEAPDWRKELNIGKKIR